MSVNHVWPFVLLSRRSKKHETNNLIVQPSTCNWGADLNNTQTPSPPRIKDAGTVPELEYIMDKAGFGGC